MSCLLATSPSLSLLILAKAVLHAFMSAYGILVVLVGLCLSVAVYMCGGSFCKRTVSSMQVYGFTLLARPPLLITITVSSGQS